ncbi:MerR family transcriptional regulator [Trujillonella endophytica]|uniref:DNA-binding transcriptional regulator, MerR family n=1 Tax=Trujillonella endophytica TaxID=673521 RepID=A0A1H8UUM5_9ACTN|nr:MerR family transcriptional regulator [Trujillella endophytica]SEP06889.1 DNA-binding transcriptional regulator, MerR family [Trujillella endophytica]
MRALSVSAPGVPEEESDRDLTVDQLAARVGMTVRNVRAYAARGLLPPPRLVGRTGYYGRQHVARLLLVREMLAEGYPLTMIERTLAHAPESASSATLALHRALLAPWLPPEPETTTTEELAARAGVAPDAALIDELVALGLVERLDDGRLRVLDPSLLTAGLQVVELGVPPTALIAAQARVVEHVRAIADVYVSMFLETGWRSLLEGPAQQAGSPGEQLDAVREVVLRLQPAAAQALLASFRTEMAARVQAALTEVLPGTAEG